MAKIYRVRARYDHSIDNVIVTEENCSFLMKKNCSNFRTLCHIMAKQAAFRDHNNTYYAYFDRAKRDIALTKDIKEVEAQEETA